MIYVAAYCRVSTDKEDQANSFASQKRYFEEYIRKNPEWELFEIYADEGITGTSTKKRRQFKRMIEDAYEKKFQFILTKEVSRFSRNILDTISYTRELKSLGIGVLFLTDRINTLNPESEMLLSFLASLAQEESRRTSMRVTWGQTRQMERGVVFGRSLLGYDVKNGNITVNPDGAMIIRLIFHQYALEQKGTSCIAKFLTDQGYRTYTGSTNWTSNTVTKILKNEKYVGDLVQKKTYTPDFLTHERKTNKGSIPFVTIVNHHEPIISREAWDLTQNRLRKNNKHRSGDSGHSDRYLFSGRIRCGECGSIFVGRFKYRKDGSKYRRWSCAKAAAAGTAGCNVGKLIREDDAVQMLKLAVRSLVMDTDAIISDVMLLAADTILRDGDDTAACSRRYVSELRTIRQKKAVMLDSYFSGDITKEEMQSLRQQYDAQILERNQRKEALECRLQGSGDPDELKNAMYSELAGILKGEIESDVFCKTILDSLTVYKDRHMELRLRNLNHIFRYIG